MVAFLSRALDFPPASTADRNGLVAVGGDLSIARLLLAYRNGIFPWPIFDEDLVTWFSPNPRAILELDALHVSRSLKKRVRRGDLTVVINRDFAGVIQGCAQGAEDRPSTWITDDMMAAYIALHREGHAHSVETRCEGKLVGGLYGVAIGGLFAGESMFSLVSEASKVALVHLVDRLKERDYRLLDIQTASPHMLSLGAKEIPRSLYLDRLREALSVDRTFV